MTKIALLSDSHGSKDRLDQCFKNISKAEIKHVIHAGDFAVYDIDQIFAKYPEIHFYIALGNCDINGEIIEAMKKLPNCTIKEVVEFELENVKFVASHIEGVAEAVVQSPEAVDSHFKKVFCHGHTHRQKIEERDEFLVLNPGALFEDGTYFIISIPKLSIEKFYYNQNLQF